MTVQASSDMSSSDSNSPIGARWAAENRPVSKSPELTRSQFDGTWRAGNRRLVTIHGHMCSLFSKFQVDADSRTCTGTLDGNTFSGMLQDDGHGISWSDGDTWTLMEPDRSNKKKPHTPTESADSEDSRKGTAKEQIPTDIDIAQNVPLTPERVAQTRGQHATTKQQTHARRRKAALITPTHSTQSPLLKLRRGIQYPGHIRIKP